MRTASRLLHGLGMALQPMIGELPVQCQCVAAPGCRLMLLGLSWKFGPMQSNFGVPFPNPSGVLRLENVLGKRSLGICSSDFNSRTEILVAGFVP